MAKATGMADDSQIPSGNNEMANLQIREGILEVSGQFWASRKFL